MLNKRWTVCAAAALLYGGTVAAQQPGTAKVDTILHNGKILTVDAQFSTAQAVAIAGQKIVSIITRNACLELGLKKGVRAFALIKATEVMVIRD